MRKYPALLACAAVIGSLGCKKLLDAARDDQADATAKESPSATAVPLTSASPAAAKPVFANAADITRYPDEKLLPDERGSVHTNMLARVSVPSGTVVATVLTGKPVTKLASHQGFFLVSFEDPKDSTRTLIGWMAQGGVVAPGATPASGGAHAAGGACPADQERFVGLGCKVECPSDDVCKRVPGTTCVGGELIEDTGGTTRPGRACLPTPKTAEKKCKAGEIFAGGDCALKCDPDAPKCPAGQTCAFARFRGATGDPTGENICQ